MGNFKKLIQFDTAGWIAISGLLMCVVSGVLLAIPYDFIHAHESVSELLLFNPAGTLIRNFHYWSAQIFFVFILLHIYDHLSKSTETNIRRKRTWSILSVVIAVIGYEMISGFILKGDAGGIQARRIIASMLETIPIAGKMFSTALTGTEENGQIIYIQHVATGTILLFIAVYEHVSKVWPKQRTFVFIFAIILVLSLLFRAPFGQFESSQIKGPWFFVGIQEILHLTSHPVYIVTFFAVLFTLFVFMPELPEQSRRVYKWVLLILSVMYLALTFIVIPFRGENWQWQGWKDFIKSDERIIIFDPVNLFKNTSSTIAVRNQKKEGCLVCHGSMTGLSESHNPAIMGCYICHKGDPFSSDKLVAHRNMIKVPGNFSNVRQTCGTQNCHPDITQRVMSSLMTSESGIVAADKFVFNETKSLNDTFHVKNLGHSAADTHLRNLCAGCHLGNEKNMTGNAAWLERGGGCNGCHLHYNNQATESMKRMQSKDGVLAPEVHPTIDIQVSNDRCKSCHSRSGRISLSYEGWNETTFNSREIHDSVHFKILPDDRVVEYIQADIHHVRGISCIDCHGSYELMGNGKHLIHKEDGVYIQCIDCHPTRKPGSMAIAGLPDRESQMIAFLRKRDPKSRVVITSKGGYPLMNSSIDSSGNILITDKLTGKNHLSKSAMPVCTKGKGHKRLSCETCHTSWVPQCIGCHNAFEEKTKGFDLLTNKQTTGTWIEFAGKTFARPPVLGISEKTESKIVTAMPGMVLTIDKESFTTGSGKSFHRLFAPASGHTTAREGRSCKSCHNNPLAIGYGDGELTYTISGKVGKWDFMPKFELNEQDSLPEDAWTGFLKEAKSPNSTRTDLRPFTVNEQKRILEVGSCLTCHDGKSMVMESALEDFEQTFRKRKKKCIMPSW